MDRFDLARFDRRSLTEHQRRLRLIDFAGNLFLDYLFLDHVAQFLFHQLTDNAVVLRQVLLHLACLFEFLKHRFDLGAIFGVGKFVGDPAGGHFHGGNERGHGQLAARGANVSLFNRFVDDARQAHRGMAEQFGQHHAALVI